MKKKLNAFTLAGCRPCGQVRSYTRVTAKGTKACSYTQVPVKGGQIQYSERETIQPIKTDINRHSTTGTNSCNHLITQSLSHLITSKAIAFTLAEVLITLAVIGIVAVLTLPALIRNHNQKAWSTAQDVFTKRLEVATRQMNTEEKLAGYDNTMDFVNELKKYIKITKVCDNSEITKCFDKEVIWSTEEEPVDMSKIRTAKSFGLDWDTDTVAVQFANGVNAIIAYNPNTIQDPFNNQFNATSNSMAILYDVSGNKNPNTNGKDISKINVTELADVRGCLIPELKDTMCITQILAPDSGYSPMTLAECNQAVSEGKLGIKACRYSTDYWAGAVKACKGTKNMPNSSQLTLLAQYIYDLENIGANEVSGLNMDTDKARQFLLVSPYSNYFFVWGGIEYSKSYSYFRDFYHDKTALRTNYKGANRSYEDRLAVCLDN